MPDRKISSGVPHIRAMKFDVPEMVPDDPTEYLRLYDEKGNALEEWIHWDQAAGKLIKGGKPRPKKMVPTGSIKEHDYQCEDCGSSLAAVSDPSRPGLRAMACSRIDLSTAPKPEDMTVIECGRHRLDAA